MSLSGASNDATASNTPSDGGLSGSVVNPPTYNQGGNNGGSGSGGVPTGGDNGSASNGGSSSATGIGGSGGYTWVVAGD